MRAIKVDHEAEIRAATEALVKALLRAVQDVEPVADLPDRLLGVDEAAAVLGLGRSLVYNLIASGELRTFRIGRRRLVPSGALAEFMAAREAATRGG